MKKKNYGWVIQDKETKEFAIDEFNAEKSIRKARVSVTRQEAREDCYIGETVRKVELTKNGRAKKIIS